MPFFIIFLLYKVFIFKNINSVIIFLNTGTFHEKTYFFGFKHDLFNLFRVTAQ